MTIGLEEMIVGGVILAVCSIIDDRKRRKMQHQIDDLENRLKVHLMLGHQPPIYPERRV